MDADFWEASFPGIHLLSDDAVASLSTAIPSSGMGFVCRVDGATMRSADDVFGQFSDLMRFPSYFGWDWAALSDCLRDLRWVPADRYLLVIDHAELMLADRVDEYRYLLEVLLDTTRHWGRQLDGRSRQGIPFKVILFIGPGCDAGVRGLLGSVCAQS